VLSNFVFLRTTVARILHQRGARLCQIGPTGQRSALLYIRGGTQK